MVCGAPDLSRCQSKYSDMAITLRLSLRIVYGLPPASETQILMRSVARLMGLDIAVPDFSTLSRRSKGLVLPSVRRQAASKHRAGSSSRR